MKKKNEKERLGEEEEIEIKGEQGRIEKKREEKKRTELEVIKAHCVAEMF